ncbi:MAG: L-threonylcarbamoyladenylate synthase [Acidobacteriota bacterium]
MTLRLSLRAPRDLPAAAEALREVRVRHGVTAIPTETYYGLAVDPCDAVAVRRVYEVKGRESSKLLLVVGGSLEQLEELVEVPPHHRERLRAAWPAAFTVVLPARRALPAGDSTLAVRVPDAPLLRSLLQRVGPLTATSANRSGTPPEVDPAAIATSIGSELDLLLDGGTTPGGAASTLLDATGTRVIVLRQGTWRVPSDWPVKSQ